MKEPSIHGLQNDIVELSEQLDDANKGLIEWREVALEALTAIKAMESAIQTNKPLAALSIAKHITTKWPANE